MTGPEEHVPGQLRLTVDVADLSPDELREADSRVREELDSIRRRRTEYRDRSLTYLTEKARDAATARDELDDAVAEARNAGVTWQEVADAVGITRQSAWRRWRRPDEVEEP